MHLTGTATPRFENGGRGPGDFEFGGGFSGGFADIFEEMFGADGCPGRRGSGGSRARGSDLRYNLEVSLEDAFKGKEADDDPCCPRSRIATPCQGGGAE